MKKIGILTFHRADNYGAFLQAYALQEYLKNTTDYDIEIVDFRDDRLENQYRIIPKLYGGVSLWCKRIAKRMLYFGPFLKRKKAFEETRTEYLNISKAYKSVDDISVEKYDYIFVGSDQVWNVDVVHGINSAYFLAFDSDHTKKISYAASVCSLPKSQEMREEFFEKIRDFSSISIRELDICSEVKSETGLDVACVLDPTLLVDRGFWIRRTDGINTNSSEKYIVVYNIEKNPVVNKAASEYAKLNNCTIINFLQREQFFVKNELRDCCTPFEFLAIIRNSECVFTSSFHATAFSLVFHKKLYVFPHSETSIRTKQLLEMVEADSAFCKDYNDYKNKENREDIDYQRVDNNLVLHRQQSEAFIANAIK